MLQTGMVREGLTGIGEPFAFSSVPSPFDHERTMAYDEGLAQILRDALASLDGVSEKKMFGGLCFMLNGHMLCGVHGNGGMARVGKEQQAIALKIKGVTPLAFTGRPMGGFVDLNEDLLCDEKRRQQVLALAIDYVLDLPDK